MSDEATHILVVDDDDRLRDLLQRYLGECGFRVSTASSAAEARVALSGLDFDLLVLDLMMPGESGLELTQSIRGDNTVKALPILLLIWRAMKTIPEGAAPLPEISWWSTVWPFFFLAIIAFVLEIIVMLIQGSEGKQGLGAVKDTIFVAIYGILLIAAIPEAAE